MIRQSLELRPDDDETLWRFAALLREQGRGMQALGRLRESAERNPALFWTNTAIAEICREQGDVSAAVKAYERAVSLGPPPHLAAPLLSKLAEGNVALGQLQQARNLYEQAIAADPAVAEIHYNFGLLLCAMGNITDAEAQLRKAIELRPGFAAAHSTRLGMLGLYRHEDPARILCEHVTWARQHADPLTDRAAPHANALDAERRLSIGYVSGDFREHSMSYYIAPILQNHDRKRFKVVCYDNWPGDDAVNAGLRQHADLWRKIHALDDDQAADLIRADGIDILVDLSGHTTMNRLMVFARKPAPVQATWLGYMCTTGMAAMDYRITDAYLDPPGATEHHYREQLARIWCAAAFGPSEDSPDVDPLPAQARGHLTFGSFNNYAKLTDNAIKAWGRILTGVPQSRLVLVAAAGDDASIQRAIAERFSRLGGPADRITVVGRRPLAQFLRLVSEVDMALDPFPSSGGTTSLHTLWMGVPIVAMEGESELSRSTAGMLRSFGLERFVARDEEQYVAIAIRAGVSPAELVQIRAGLRPSMRQSAILDGPRVTRSLEQAFRQMWETYIGR